jgi:hypothetical protein
MPEILITAGARASEQPVLLRERITARDLESDHFAAQLVERVGWAVLDADAIEEGQAGARADRRPADPDG